MEQSPHKKPYGILILLNNPDATFTAGETIHGKVQTCFDKPQKCKSITLANNHTIHSYYCHEKSYN
jgi:hypothetical protein